MKAKYKKLIEIIKEDIKHGKYLAGEKIPSEKEFMDMYGYSRDTVRKSLQNLVEHNILKKKQGSGSFVAEEGYNQTLLKFYSFTDEMRKRGKEPSSEILDFKIITPKDKVKEIFKGKEEIYKLIRLRLADKKPMIYEITYLNIEKLKDLSLIKLKKKPLYEIIQKDYDINFERATEKFHAILPTEEIMELLKMKSFGACMKFERYVYSEGELLEYTESYARGDNLTFEVELK